MGSFVFHNNTWYLVNENMPDLVDLTQADNRISIPKGGKVELVDGQKLLLSREDGGRLVIVQMVSA